MLCINYVIVVHLRNQKMIFMIDIVATGIDPMKDRVIQLAVKNIQTGEIFQRFIKPLYPNNRQKYQKIPNMTNTKILQEGKTCSEVFYELFYEWLPKQQVYYFISHNGHRFTFPLLTKEMRRCSFHYPKNTYCILWDTLYSTRKRTNKYVLEQSRRTAVQKINETMSLYEDVTHTSLTKDLARAIEILKQDNEEVIHLFPQPTFETIHLRVNFPIPTT